MGGFCFSKKNRVEKCIYIYTLGDSVSARKIEWKSVYISVDWMVFCFNMKHGLKWFTHIIMDTVTVYLKRTYGPCKNRVVHTVHFLDIFTVLNNNDDDNSDDDDGHRMMMMIIIIILKK